MTNQNRELNLNDLDAVTGGNLAVEAGKILLGYVLGKLMDSSSYTPVMKQAETLVAWQKSLK